MSKHLTTRLTSQFITPLGRRIKSEEVSTGQVTVGFDKVFVSLFLKDNTTTKLSINKTDFDIMFQPMLHLEDTEITKQASGLLFVSGMNHSQIKLREKINSLKEQLRELEKQLNCSHEFLVSKVSDPYREATWDDGVPYEYCKWCHISKDEATG
jgi:hypothetical protein